jgi:hypothetical protein
VTAGEKP